MAHALLSRRAVLGHGMAAAVLASSSLAVSQTIADQPLVGDAPSEMAKAINAHKNARAHWMACLDRRDGWEDEWFALVSKRLGEITDPVERKAERRRFFQENGYKALEDAESEASDREAEALGRVIDLPPRNLAELREKVEYLRTMPDGDGAFSVFEDPIMSLLESILKGGALA